MGITNGYATLDEFHLQFSSSSADQTDDVAIEAIIQAASRAIDNDCHRRFFSTSADETRTYTGTGRGRVFTDDILTVTSIKTDQDGDRVYEVTWATTDYDLMPENALLDGRPYLYIQAAPYGNYGFASRAKSVQVVGTFGFCATGSHPDVVKQACLLQANRWYQRKKAPFGVTAPNEFGQQTVLDAVDPDISHMLTPLRRLVGAGY